MGILYQIDPSLGAIFVLWDGVVSADEFLASVRKIIADPGWPARRRLHFTDLRTGTMDESIDEGVLKQAAELYGAHPLVAEVKAAVLAGDAFKRAVIFEKFIAQYRPSVIVFNGLETAAAWLGLDAGAAERAFQRLRQEARGQAPQPGSA